MANKKSAKDLAFDRERAKLKHETNLANQTIADLKKEINQLYAEIGTLRFEKEQLTAENNTLKTTSLLSNEELKILMDEIIRNKELRESMQGLASVGTALGPSLYRDKLKLFFNEEHPDVKVAREMGV